MSLANQTCEPCKGGVAPMTRDEAAPYLAQLDAGWSLNAAGHLERRFEFGDFVGAMDFARRCGELAETHGHHPDLHIGWGRCTVELWTHKIDGLAVADFVMAAKIEADWAANAR